MNRLLSLAHLTAIDLAPPDLIHAAADAGFDAVGLRLIRVTDTSPGYPLMQDPAMMRATQAALRNTGVRVHDIEFVKIQPDTDIATLLPFLDAGAALNAAEVIAAPYDPDHARLVDRLGALAEQAAARGLGVSLEFFPWTDVPNLETALRLITQAGPGVGVLVDSLHFDRSDSRLDTLRNIPRDRMRFAHLCDAPVHPPYDTDELLYAGRAERLAPGTGQIPLSEVLRALPADLPLGVEVPMTQRTKRAGHADVLAHIMAATRHPLATTDTPEP